VKILILEDDPAQASHYQRQTVHGATVLVATTVRTATQLFETNATNIVAIFLDGHKTPGGSLVIANLVQHIKDSGFTGPLVATSADASHADHLITAGCNRVMYQKYEVDHWLAQLSELMSPGLDVLAVNPRT
jgi:DNA-binding response OmpR family regulator